MRRILLQSTQLLALSVVAAVSAAHDFWISPDDTNIDSGDLVRVTLRNGPHFAGDVVPRYTFHIERYEFVPFAEGAEPVPVQGRDGSSQSFVRPETSGAIVYKSDWNINTLAPDKFEEYLRHEGLDAISADRAARSEADLDGREVYTRCAKALISVQDPAAASSDRAVGLPLELVLDDVTSDEKGVRVVHATLLWQGKPLPDATVRVTAEQSRQTTINRTTDAGGRISFPAPDAGNWMLTTIHMTRAEDIGGVDWKSYWASLTFSLPAGLSTQPVNPS